MEKESKKGIAVVITSGKGGVGKTTTTANIGSALANLGNSVVVVDADIGLRNLDVVLGLENRIVYDIVDVVKKNCKIKQGLIKDKKNENLFLLPAAQTKDKTAVSKEEMLELVEELKDMYDYVIIDSPAGIEQGFQNSIAGASKAYIVTTPEVSAVRDADRVIGLLQAQGIEEPKLIVNRIRYDMVQRGDMMDVEDIKDILAIDVIGIVPDDEAIVVSTNKGEPVVYDDNSLAGEAFRNIARRIVGEEIPFISLGERQDSKFKKIFNILFKKA